MSSPKQPLTAATANPNAATAAAAVFKRQSSPSLSAAAAAAALRARPHTPTNVAGVQTKRTVRRSGSVSSSSTVQDGLGRPGLQRRGSSASMTERTFRSPSPSPHRPASAHGSSSSRGGIGRHMPPIPAIPKDLDAASVTSGTSARSQARKTAIGISGTPVRVASQRLGQDVAPTWFGAAQVGDAGTVRRIDPAMASPPSSPPQPAVEERASEGQRPSSPSSSINFSYPARVRIGSPPVSPEDRRDSMEFFGRGTGSQGPASGHQSSRPKQANRSSSGSSAGPVPARSSSALSERSLVYDPHSRRMVPREEVPEESWEKQTTSRKKNQTHNRAGSHLSRGTMGRTQVHVPEEQRRMDLTSDRSAFRETVSSHRTKPVQKDVVKQSSREPTFAQDSAILFPGPKERSREVAQTAQPMRRQPSVVKEEPELESEADLPEPETASRHQDMMSALDQIPSRPKLSSTLIRTSDSEVQAPATAEKRRPAPAVGQRQPSPMAEPVVMAPPTESKTGTASPRDGLQETGLERGHSASPVRQTHFGPVQNTLTVKHSPPPRSISPRKSALKHQSPPRCSSPTDTNSEASAPRDELTVPRKKPARVSFDDEHTVVVGESATTRNGDESPVPASPQNNPNRRPWYSNMARGKQKDVVSLDDDEVMKPRPALPSFGSVRVKKPRELQNGDAERPLVRPSAETVYSPMAPSSPAESPVRANVAGSSQVQPESLGLGLSNDVAVGALPAQERSQSRRNAANISKFREPLPPIVTSVEGGDYMDDTLSSSEVEEPQALAHAHVEAQSHEEPVSTSDTIAQPSEPDSAAVMPEIPSIAVTLPSPAIEKEPMIHAIDAHIPGEFPQEDTASELSQAVEHDTGDDATGSTGKAALDALVQDDDVRNDTRATATMPAPPSQSTQSSDEETDNDSIYSDAYEDVAEDEGSGFQSLNAVLGGPFANITASQSAPALHEKTFQPPPVEHACSSATTVVASKEAKETPVPDDWEKAKAYWRGLTADKRAQLEREARDDAATDADVEETKPEAKQRRRKSTEQRVSARQSLEQRQQQQQRVQNPERSYMIQPGSKWAEQQDVSIPAAPPLRTTLRAGRQQQENVQRSQAGVEKSRMRQSMRANPSTTGHAATGRAATGRAATGRAATGHAATGHTAQRPSTAKDGPSSSSVPGQAVQPAKTAPRRLTTARTPPLRRRGSDSSESSFIRARSGNNVQASGIRGSMRSLPMSTGQAEPSSGRKLLRALSPSRSAFRRASDPPPVAMPVKPAMAGKPAIRQSLRDSSVERKSNGMHMLSFGRSSGSKASRLQSRFEDSSDEDVVLPNPVTPSPRAMGTTNSTQTRMQSSDASTALLEEDEVSEELSDSSDEEGSASKERKTKQTALALAALNEAQALRQARSGRGSIGSAQTSPVLGGTGGAANAGMSTGDGGKSARRSSFMAVLRRKMSGSGAGVSRPEVMDSAARRDTKLERSAEELLGMRAASSEQAPGRSPKLRRRITSLPTSATVPTGLFSRRWGAHQGDAEAAADMSGAADGGAVDYERQIMALNRAAVGSLGTRSLSTGNLLRGPVPASSPVGVVAAADATQPKKKFGALRRMFRLDD